MSKESVIKKARSTRSTEDYDTMTHYEHILKTPDTYIGSTYVTNMDKNLFNPETQAVENRSIDYCEGIEQLIKEIWSNSVDNIISTRHLKASESKKQLASCRSPPVVITISTDRKTIKTKNLGEPIPIAPKKSDETNEKELKLVPEIIFGQLLSSSNYSTKNARVGAGRNGYGAKLTNIYSKRFKVKIYDDVNKQTYTCEWVNNMKKIKSRKVKPGYEFSKKEKRWVSLAKDSDPSKESYVEIEFELDFDRFNYVIGKDKDGNEILKPLECLSDEMILVFKRIALDYSFTSKIPIKFNDVVFDARLPKTFAKYYYPSDEICNRAIIHYEWATSEDEAKYKNSTVNAISKSLTTEGITPLVELIILDTPDNGNTFGFVNGTNVPEGIHVFEAFTKVSGSLLSSIENIKAFSGSSIKPNDIKNHISLIVNCHLTDPRFTSQTKQCLANPRPKITISPDVFKNALTTSSGNKWVGLYAHLSNVVELKLKKTISKSDCKIKNRRVTNISGASEANFAGTNKSDQCTLWIPEGDSAAAYVEKRIDLLPGKKDFHGIYACRGKFINVKSATNTMLAANKEYCDLKTLLGLSEGVDYSKPEEAKKLKYGRVIIAADADEDGSSIRSLLINCFMSRWPSLITTGRIAYLATPAIRVFCKKSREILERFFSDANYYTWEKTQSETYLKTLKVKHLKGLASSSDKDVLDDLNNAPTVCILYDDKTEESLDLAFSNKRADDRKRWIEDWRKNGSIGQDDDVVLESVSKLFNSEVSVPSPKKTKITKSNARSIINNVSKLPTSSRTVSAIINKDLAEYSFSSLFRSIANVCDGLKRSQRQAVWHCLNYWNYGVGEKNESLKVSRLASAVAEATNYAHGESSMQGTIISLAQDFTGANNVNILYPDGQFGSRKSGPSVHGAPRYINTKLSDIAPFIFSRELVELVDRRSVEGELVESEWLPCDIPLSVINGVCGIGTGWSSFIPLHNPLDVINWIISKIENNDGDTSISKILPYYKGYRGKLISSEDSKTIVSEGLYSILRQPSESNPTYDVEVTELPIGIWMKKYEKWLNSLIEENRLTNFRDLSDSNNAHFILKNFSTVENIDTKGKNNVGGKKQSPKFPPPEISLKILNLTKSMSLNNMVLIDTNGSPKRYDTVEEIISVHYERMSEIYSKYKEKKIYNIKEQIKTLTNKETILNAIVTDKLKIYSRERKDIINDINKLNLSVEEYDKLKLSDCTKEKIEEIIAKINSLKNELLDINNTSSNQFWKQRLLKLKNKLI